MSKIGTRPIPIPEKVDFSITDGMAKVKGPLGEMNTPVPANISLVQEEKTIQVGRMNDTKEARQNHGMIRALLNNLVIGVSTGWKKNLELVGVGYRAQVKGDTLVLALGYSHEVLYKIPDGIKITVTDQTRIELTSIDKQKLGEAADKIRSFRSPEPYKGKGVKYANERILRKAGKAGKGGKK